MTKMVLQIRPMQLDDSEQLLTLYQQFVLSYVGSAKRTLKSYKRLTRRKDDLRWVALDEQGKIVGYINAIYAKGRRQGRIHEIIIAPKQDFVMVAHLLVEKVFNILIEKGAAVIQAASIRNPHYPQIFPKLGFNVETAGVFMYTITDTARFLDEISPIIVRRLQRLPDWNGLLQVACQENSKFYKKDREKVQTLLSTNHSPDCKVTLTANTLSGVLLGAIDAQRAWTEGTIAVETTLRKEETSKLLSTLFPRQQFLALDYW